MDPKILAGAQTLPLIIFNLLNQRLSINLLEAASGVEPKNKVLQALAFPLGYAAFTFNLWF
jgi:hypothetical protein